uniref:Uncharacterized protein n=1 Tax=Glossina pallidipes TaxID=7398 RepID=A0A1A9ZXW6_GLOPL
MNGFRISGFPAAVSPATINSDSNVSAAASPCSPSVNAAISGNTNKLTDVSHVGHDSGLTSHVTANIYQKSFNLLAKENNSNSNGNGNGNGHGTTNGGGICGANLDELDLDIKESTLCITSNSALSMLQPSPPPLTTAIATNYTTTAPIALKEALYAAFLQQYRNSPTPTISGSGGGSSGLGLQSTNASTGYCPPVPQHRNVNGLAGLQQQQTITPNGQPLVPRRSHSTPRPISASLSISPNTGINTPLQPNALNGQRPRSLDRFNTATLASGKTLNNPSYQPPPIPLRRFVPNSQTQHNASSPQHFETAKFQGKKSTSIDNIRNTLSTADYKSNAMRHSVTFHGRQGAQINAENGFNVDELTSAQKTSTNTTVSNKNAWKKSERPMSYAYGGSVPDQDYLENQLRAYSEQLRTITESVRKYSEQAKLLSELKRQQLVVKQQQLGNASNANSQTHLDQLTPPQQQIPISKSTGSFNSNMISQEMVGKSLASLSQKGQHEAQTPSTQLRLFLDNIRSSMRSEYQQNIPEEVLKPIKEPLTTKSTKISSTPITTTNKRTTQLEELIRKSPGKKPTPNGNLSSGKFGETELPTPSDQLRLFLDAIRSNKIPENEDKPKMVNSQTLDAFITKPLQMPDVTSGTPGNTVGANAVAIPPPSRRRPKSSITCPNNATSSSSTSSSNVNKIENHDHSLTTSESFHQISDNLRLMSEDLKALSPSRVVHSNSSGSLKALAATSSELKVAITSPISTSPTVVRGPFTSSTSNSSLSSVANSSHTNNSSHSTTPSTAPLINDFNDILDSFQQMADKYKSKGSYDYLRKCSEALRQHSQQLKLQQQQQQQQQQQRQPQQSSNNAFNDDMISSITTPGSIREAVQNLLMQPRNGFQILDDRMRLFIDIIDSQDKLSQETDKL